MFSSEAIQQTEDGCSHNSEMVSWTLNGQGMSKKIYTAEKRYYLLPSLCKKAEMFETIQTITSRSCKDSV